MSAERGDDGRTPRRERATLVVPCYNEVARLDGETFLSLAARDDDADLLFVDDGSTDETLGLLRALANRAPTRVHLLPLERNRGKAEAVRLGLLAALARGAEIVGYLDADLATPVSEAKRLLGLLRQRPDTQVLLAARVGLLGRDIRRSAGRHYLGRLFATAAALALGVRIYDTQCGAKLFRRSPALEAALGDAFLSRWIFDVELLGRLLAGGWGREPLPLDAIVEEPLREWQGVPGSKLGLTDMARAVLDLARIAADLQRRRGQAV